MRRSARFALATLLASSTACSGWSRIPGGLPSQPPEFKHFQVWSHGALTTLHSLHVEGDSISGIPTGQPRACEECRIAIPVNQVDSVLAGGTGQESSQAFGLVAGGIVGFFLFLFLTFSVAAEGT